MNFLTFFLYFVGSTLLYQALIICMFLVRRKYLQRKFNKRLASGEIRMVTMEELMEQMKQQEKKTWN